MALTGFNPDVVSSSINSVKSAYENLIRVLGDEMQNQFVQGMADKWACNQAQSFFNDTFKPAIDGLINKSNLVFESVVNSMNSAGQAWASETNSAYSPQSFSLISKSIDTSVIQENIQGVRGIDLEQASAVASKLSTISENAKSALSNAQQAVQNCGFIGGNQADSLISSLTTIKTNIDSVTEEITSQSRNAIERTIADYSNTEGKISQAFAGEGN